MPNDREDQILQRAGLRAGERFLALGPAGSLVPAASGIGAAIVPGAPADVAACGPDGVREAVASVVPGGRVLVIERIGEPASFVDGALRATTGTGLTELGSAEERCREAGLTDLDGFVFEGSREYRSGEHLLAEVTGRARGGDTVLVLDAMLRERSGGGPASLGERVHVVVGTVPLA